MPLLHPDSRLARTGRRAAVALLAPALVSLAACEAVVEPSEYVNQSRIHTAYELEYDADQDVTTARATFRFGGEGGTLLQLSGDSRVTVDGATMTLVREPFTQKAYYERAIDGRLASATFRFEDTEGREYENTAAIRAADFPAGLGPIDNDASHTFEWSGTTLTTGEHVDVTLHRLLGAPALGLFRQSSVGMRSVVLDRAQLQHVAPGSVTMSMEREATREPAERPAVGGSLTVRYKARPVAVEVLD